MSLSGYAWPEHAETASRRVGLAQRAAATVTAREIMREGLQGAALGEALRERKLRKVQKALG